MEGDLSSFARVGAAMTRGSLVVRGAVGPRFGTVDAQGAAARARRAPYLRHVGDVSGGGAGEILLPGDAA